ncbi:ATP-dependent DNA helicase [Streptomyces caatingaensis]|uniref:ATP-dependent DNA helicase n=1 Tax=Streptomyces caatingaensis TaxID=1678637 RepID=UPI00099D39A9|nr:ATP-dependent RecD-like DNA helicase [Streptomyces caatingaensis]
MNTDRLDDEAAPASTPDDDAAAEALAGAAAEAAAPAEGAGAAAPAPAGDPGPRTDAPAAGHPAEAGAPARGAAPEGGEGAAPGAAAHGASDAAGDAPVTPPGNTAGAGDAHAAQDSPAPGATPEPAEGDNGPEAAARSEGAEGTAQGGGATARDTSEAAGDANGPEGAASSGAAEGAAAGPRRSAVAEALAAAVRAVESGERSADSFFNEPVRRERPAPRTAVVRESRPPRPRPERVVDEGVLGGVREVLAAGGAPERLAAAAVAALGEQAADLLREDPWLLLGVGGVRPEQADGFARALLGAACGPGDERRARALVAWLLERAALAGHTVLESGKLTEELARRSVPDPDEAVQAAVAEGAVLVFQEPLREPAGEDGEEAPVRLLLGLDRYAMAEESLADGLARLLGTLPERELDWEAAAAGAPTPSAAELIRAVAGSGLVAHSGGEAARAEPAAVVAAARSLGLRAVAAAFTEDGRRRLAAAGDEEAVTVAGLLSGAEGPERDPEGTLPLDLLAVLDAPQLDVETAAMLVESLADGARLVLSGDPAGLDSAGPGRVLADVLAARACPVVVSRTPDPGPIGELVSGIGVGELAQVDAPGKEVVITPVRDAGEAVHRTVQLVADSVPRAFAIPPEGTQVITPGHGGAAGTRALNTALKQRLNPGPGRFGGFDPGDRVVHVPAPGRIVPGTVVSADAEGLRLDCSGTPVTVPPSRVADEVRHGWAVTAHQAAGTRWPAAVVVLPGDATDALDRPWVHTAFGRGERHLSVVHGAGPALARAVAERPGKERSTRLASLLGAQVRPAG